MATRRITSMSGARAAVEAIASRGRDPIRVWSLQEIHGPVKAASGSEDQSGVS